MKSHLVNGRYAAGRILVRDRPFVTVLATDRQLDRELVVALRRWFAAFRGADGMTERHRTMWIKDGAPASRRFPHYPGTGADNETPTTPPLPIERTR